MSQWANEHPEQMEEIARLPLREQNAALRAAIGYDPDAIRDYAQERIHHPDLRGGSPASDREAPAGEASSSQRPPAGQFSPRRRAGVSCDNCGAPEDMRCQPWCLSEQYS